MPTSGERAKDHEENATSRRSEGEPLAFTVMRCSACGDTFPADDPTTSHCRSCGSVEIAPAVEPLL